MSSWIARYTVYLFIVVKNWNVAGFCSQRKCFDSDQMWEVGESSKLGRTEV